MSIDSVFQMALRQQQAGRPDVAQSLYRQILAENPNHFQTLHLLGVLSAQAGHHEEAVALLTRAAALQPNLAEVHYNLGNALMNHAQPDAAIAAYQKAIALNPKIPDAHYNLGNALMAKAQPEPAIAAYQKAVALKPDFAEAHANLGSALLQQGKNDEALAALRHAISLKPNHAKAYSNLGNLFRGNGQLDEAIAAYHQAIALNPKSAAAHNNLANALRDRGDLDEAAAAWRQTLALKPDFSEAHSNLIMLTHCLPAYDTRAIAAENQRWYHKFAQPLERLIQPHPNDRNPDRLLRIGYVSADFWAHVSSFFLVPLLESHDPRQVELFCYAQVARPDHITERLQRTAHWRNTTDLSDDQLASLIREDRIDILVDLKLHTAANRLKLFARKPAPLQVTWLGYPGTTGLHTIDYRLSDPYLDPVVCENGTSPPSGHWPLTTDHYSEKTLRLPETFWCYDPLDGRDVPLNLLPALHLNAVTFGCLNNFCKINPAVLQLWAKVLHATPNARLLILAPNGLARTRTLELLAKEAILPARIEFVAQQPRKQYLETYHRIDIALDTFPCNGHTTSLDSFYMGVPVVTLVGQTVDGRAGLCQLMNLNLPELIAHTPDQYLQIATQLAADLPRLAHLRQTLRPRMQSSPLMNALRFAQNFEAAYRQIWQHWCAAPPTPPQ